jgi:hypothetical protein
MYVNATDLDDPTTPNGQLFYQIVIQLPKIGDVMYFQINNRTGGISLTPQGKSRDALIGLSQRKDLRSVTFTGFPFLPCLPQDLKNWIQLRILTTIW